MWHRNEKSPQPNTHPKIKYSFVLPWKSSRKLVQKAPSHHTDFSFWLVLECRNISDLLTPSEPARRLSSSGGGPSCSFPSPRLNLKVTQLLPLRPPRPARGDKVCWICSFFSENSFLQTCFLLSTSCPLFLSLGFYFLVLFFMVCI